ncbi:type 2 lanthipeptide synthetase LanM family protein [Sphaerisporangium sp. NPDC005289]|uniref:type 2 lanthipeptide synthetase LanM family protein n=1 Tax=Sphaerisporangium sp. NPDC005289 TaxID=3155247 RepID=UPI0033A05FCC
MSPSVAAPPRTRAVVHGQTPPAPSAPEAVARVPGGSTGPAASLSDAVQPLVRRAADRLVAGGSHIEGIEGSKGGRSADGAGLVLASIRERFAADLTAALTRIAARVLVYELNARRAGGRLPGGTPAERFAGFVRQVGTGDGLAALLKDYPVLARLLDQAADQAVETGLELLTRYTGDGAHLRELLGGDPGGLVEFSAAGDGHAGGRAVALVTLAGGAKVVYRPRPVEAHVCFGEVAGWLNERVPGLGLRTPRVACRDGYGWTEFVPAEPCADAAEVERFYVRAGALLALLYALNAVDVHYENLIACGGQPVLVDVETLFHPALPVEASADPALHALRDSVQRTALLPKLMVGELGALDISGLGGDKDEVYPFLAAQWEEAGTDTMRLVRGVARFAGAANRPRLDGVDADPADHVPSLLAGFRRAYDAIAAGRDDLLRGPLSRFGRAQVRVLLRPTRFYGELMIESTHPDVVRTAADRDEVFGLLETVSAGDPARTAAVPSERADLWAGDIPYFSAVPGSPEIRDSRGEPLSWRPAECGLDTVAAKLSRLGTADRENQEWLIEASMAARSAAGPRVPVDGTTGGSPEPGNEASTTRRAQGDGTAHARRAPEDGMAHGRRASEEGMAHARPGPGSRGAGGRHVPGESPGAPSQAMVPHPEALVAAARGIADRLCATAHRDGGTVNWLGLEPVEDGRWMVMPLGGGLAGGYLGVALFLAEASRATGISRYMDVARMAVRPIPRLLEQIGANPELLRAVGCGGFGGLGGIAFGLSQLGLLLGDSEVTSWVAPAVEAAGAAVTDEAPLDVHDGLAGCLAAMLAVRQTTGSTSADRVAAACAERLTSAAPSADLPPGFAFGAAGVGWALARYGRGDAGGKVGARLLADARARAPEENTWCHGAAGVRLALADTADTPDIPADAAEAAPTTLTTVTADAALAGGSPSPMGAGVSPGGRTGAGVPAGGPSRSAGRTLGGHGLCHGETGRLETLSAPARRGDASARRELRRDAGRLLASLDTHGARCGTPRHAPTPGLLDGLAGIGHGLLRLALPETTTSVLLLRPADVGEIRGM